MERCVGEAYCYGASFAAGIVKEHGWSCDAAPEGVDTAAVEVVALSAAVALLAEGGFCPDAFGLIAVDGGAAFLVDEESAGGEGLITNHPGGHAVAGTAGEEAICGVGFEEVRGDAGRLSIGVAVDEGPDELLDVPSAFLELDGEPIKEAGVDWNLALDAEVLG